MRPHKMDTGYEGVLQDSASVAAESLLDLYIILLFFLLVVLVYVLIIFLSLLIIFS